MAATAHNRGEFGGDWLTPASRAGVAVLGCDRDLYAAAAGQRVKARGVSLAQVIDLSQGSSLDPRWLDRGSRGYGLLVLHGLLLHETVVDGRAAADLLADGDLVAGFGSAIIASRAGCSALTGTRMAVLDRHWVSRMSPYPSVGAAIAARSVRQSRRVAAMVAITNHLHLDVRLWLLLWHLADRFGRVHPDGVHLDLPITHDHLAKLARSRRPSVSTALGALSAQGVLRPERTGWVLTAKLGAGPRPRPRPSGRSGGGFRRLPAPVGALDLAAR